MGCFSENDVLALLGGTLVGEALSDAEQHLDGCATCRRLVGEVARPRLPHEIGRYRVTRKVGAGGMGTVYAADDPQLGREVALKLVNASRLAELGEELRARLSREAQAMARLAHPNVVTVHDIGTVGDELFLAMELVDGGTLGAWLREAPRDWREILTKLLDAGRGLAAAHAAGVIHRDFKPDNVLLGKDGRVRVTDFGLAQMGAGAASPGVEPADVTLTATGSLVGTPAYMAPEQHAGDALDVRTDVFSFSVTAWEALHGERPFAGATIAELRASLADEEVRPPKRRLPRALDDALRRGLARDPAARWPTMDALLAAIERASRPRRWWLAAVPLAAAAVGGALLFWPEIPAHDSPPAIANPIAESLSARGWTLLSDAVLRSGKPAAALALAEAAVERLRKLDAPGPLADALDGLGRVLVAKARLGEARALHESALALRGEAGGPSLLGLARVELAAEHLAEAEAFAVRAASASRASRPAELAALALQARILVRREAKEKLGQTLARARELGGPIPAAIEASGLMAAGDEDGALALVEAAAERAESQGLVEDMLELRLLTAELQGWRGEEAEAKEILDSLYEEAESLGYEQILHDIQSLR